MDVFLVLDLKPVSVCQKRFTGFFMCQSGYFCFLQKHWALEYLAVC